MDWKEQEGLLYENGAGKKIVGHSKLKLWTFFWSHDEREWPLQLKVVINVILYVAVEMDLYSYILYVYH